MLPLSSGHARAPRADKLCLLQKGPVYNGICGAGADWDHMSFNPTNTNDADCKVDPDFHFLDNVDKKASGE